MQAAAPELIDLSGETKQTLDDYGLGREEPDLKAHRGALAEVRASIDELDKIAGRLARSAVAHGASWEDVGSSLRLDADKARAAYER